jgi:hypothetical protein
MIFCGQIQTRKSFEEAHEMGVCGVVVLCSLLITGFSFIAKYVRLGHCFPPFLFQEKAGYIMTRRDLMVNKFCYV